jgi:hypothetical protein
LENLRADLANYGSNYGRAGRSRAGADCLGCDIPAVIRLFTYLVCLDHHIPDPQLVIRMIDRKEFSAIQIAVCCAVAAYGAGEHLQYSKPPAQQMLTLATASSTTSAVVVTFNPMTFAKVEPPPPVVPPGDRQQQG